MSQQTLTAERWRKFPPGTQLLHLGSELHRLERSLARGDSAETEHSWLRALRLADLSIETAHPGAPRRELCRVREVLAGIQEVEQPARSVRQLRRILVGDR